MNIELVDQAIRSVVGSHEDVVQDTWLDVLQSNITDTNLIKKYAHTNLVRFYRQKFGERRRFISLYAELKSGKMLLDLLPWYEGEESVGIHVFKDKRIHDVENGFGICAKCGALNQDLGNGLCKSCFDLPLSPSMKRYYYAKSKGLCVWCCKEPALVTSVYCEKHPVINREKSRRSYSLRRQSEARRRRQHYWELKLAGRCVKCGKPASSGSSFCFLHLMLNRFRSRAYRENANHHRREHVIDACQS